MKYISTRDNIKAVSGIEAIKSGMVPQGGLFIPKEIPAISHQQLDSWMNLSYTQLAQKIFQLFLADDFSEKEITQIVHQAYHKENFTTEEITPLTRLNDQLFLLELFHGPTGAFKDIALQALPLILSLIIKKLSINNQLLILVATSGDTGKAALEGFKNIPGIQIVVYFPFQKVSRVQEWQMLTTEGNNTHVIALEGNFDDCQNAVKQIFTDADFCRMLEKKGFEFSSANSINWGRLFPQIVYYFYAYLYLLRKKHIRHNETINFVVPTGNFGNILAAWYAKEMGLPIEKLICASNINKVLTDFFNSGVYDINRPLVTTISPSMDILISNNLERFLFEISGRQGEFIVKLMKDLREKGMFILEESLKNKMREIIFASFADETETLSTIKSVYHEYHYLVDPHTAVGIKVFTGYQRISTQKTKTVITATATPFKFNKAVLTALIGEVRDHKKEEFILLQKLSNYTDLPIPAMLRDLDKKPIKKQFICPKDKVQQCLLEILKIE
ncbi:MAG: threonine synthase [Atribacterota bacterium]|nr:threonine synthase [Atribacterota bacterium]MDD5636716.1 threonine synthase [Atribacterota bacterium]